MQTVLDSTALSLQAMMDTKTTAQLMVMAQALVNENTLGSNTTATVTNLTIDTLGGKLSILVHMDVPTIFVAMVGVRSLPASLQAEVTQASLNLEVSIALDITGSMLGSKLTALRTATNTLIDMLVKVQQPPLAPTYSKMAIVPWSNSVSVGAYAASVRGAITDPAGKPITGATWSASVSTITAINKSSSPPTVTTSSANGLNTGDQVMISGVGGMAQVNGKIYTVTVTNTTKFTLNGVNSGTLSTYSSGGKAYKCQSTNCDVTITSNGHNFVNTDVVYVNDVAGLTNINNKWYRVTNKTGNTVTLSGSGADLDGVQTYSGSGELFCTKYGCPYLNFTTAAGGDNTLPVSDCVSDRTNPPAAELAPSLAALNFVYPSIANACVTPSIQPLTSDKTALKNTVISLVAKGSTAGHIGLAWGWYMVSPAFGYLWPSSSRPGSYGDPLVVKAIVLMTDGDFNTTYCNGVISRDALTGSGADTDHISCNSQNGSSAAQATALCTAIKNTGAILYTVGFDMAGNTTAATLLRNCASTPQNYFDATTGADLQVAFKEIAKSLSELRLSK